MNFVLIENWFPTERIVKNLLNMEYNTWSFNLHCARNESLSSYQEASTPLIEII